MDPLRRLIDAVPRATLAEIIFEMLAAEPAKRRPGRPRKPSRPRGRARKPPAGNGADPGEAPARLGRRRASSPPQCHTRLLADVLVAASGRLSRSRKGTTPPPPDPPPQTKRQRRTSRRLRAAPPVAEDSLSVGQHKASLKQEPTAGY
jgi:hypothetical protein